MVSWVYPQTASDYFACCTRARLYANKLPLGAAQSLSNDVPPTFEQHGAAIDAVLNDQDISLLGGIVQHRYSCFFGAKESSKSVLGFGDRNPMISSSGCTAACPTSTSA